MHLRYIRGTRKGAAPGFSRSFADGKTWGTARASLAIRQNLIKCTLIRQADDLLTKTHA
jgi:hypothetical protein